MTYQEGLQRLHTISSDSRKILRVLEMNPRTEDSQSEVRLLATVFRNELHGEYERIIPERAQKKMTLFELTIYSPTIEEVWKETGISRLKVDGPISERWAEVFEAVAYKTSKYIS